MSSVFRIRPSNDMSLDELLNGYLWFSRPTEYHDIEDSNIIAISENNESVRESLNRVFFDFRELGKEVSYSGICCFTDSLPKIKEWKAFPNGYNGICIEYDKDAIDLHFIKTYGLGDGFKKVEYLSCPLISKYSSEFDILWETNENGFIYKALRDIERDIKLYDKFLLKLLTRINDKYKKQKEMRVILGGRNIPDRDPNLRGYKIQIPKNSIKQIFIHPTTQKKYIEKVEKIIPQEIPLVILSRPARTHSIS